MQAELVAIQMNDDENATTTPSTYNKKLSDDTTLDFEHDAVFINENEIPERSGNSVTTVVEVLTDPLSKFSLNQVSPRHREVPGNSIRGVIRSPPPRKKHRIFNGLLRKFSKQNPFHKKSVRFAYPIIQSCSNKNYALPNDYSEDDEERSHSPLHWQNRDYQKFIKNASRDEEVLKPSASTILHQGFLQVTHGNNSKTRSSKQRSRKEYYCLLKPTGVYCYKKPSHAAAGVKLKLKLDLAGYMDHSSRVQFELTDTHGVPHIIETCSIREKDSWVNAIYLILKTSSRRLKHRSSCSKITL